MISENTRLMIVIILILVSFIMINAGIINGEVQAVEAKSTNICMECIGIG